MTDMTSAIANAAWQPAGRAPIAIFTWHVRDNRHGEKKVHTSFDGI